MSDEQRQEFEKLSLKQIIEKKDGLKSQLAKLIPQLASAAEKKSERKKAGKIVEKITETINVMIVLDEVQDAKDE